MLIGEGGSGRHSLSKLAAFINNLKIYQNKAVDGIGLFREKIKEIFEDIIFNGREYLLLFSEFEVSSE